MPVLDARSLDEADLDALRELGALLHPTGVAPAKPRGSFTPSRVLGRVAGAGGRGGVRRTAARSESAA